MTTRYSNTEDTADFDKGKSGGMVVTQAFLGRCRRKGVGGSKYRQCLGSFPEKGSNEVET